MFLLSRRWIGLALLVAILAAVCVRLGFWQYHRLHERLAENTVISTNLSSQPAPLTERSVDQPVDDDAEWMPVRVRGQYDTRHQITVRFSTRDGRPGVDVVTPLITENNTAILINRGWMETDNSADKPTTVPEPPDGTVEVTGWLRPDSDADDQAVTPHDDQVRAISSRGMNAPYRLYHGYLNLRDSSPQPDSALEAEPKPDRGQGPHLFYAIQWWFFAALAVFGYGYFAYSEARTRRSGTATTPADDASVQQSERRQ